MNTNDSIRCKKSNAKHFRILVSAGLLLLVAEGLVVLGEEVGVFLVGGLLEHGLLPQVGGQEGVGPRDSGVGCLS